MSRSGDARNEHERRVADFLKQAQAANPSLYDEVTARHTVLTENQLASRRSKEISAGLIEDGYTAAIFNQDGVKQETGTAPQRRRPSGIWGG